MRTREHDRPDPAEARELAAIEAALAGRPVDPDLEDLAELSVELRELRPRPAEEFAAELDSRAASGFPRPRRAARARRLLPRRSLIPAFAGGLAVAVLAIGIGVSQIGDDGGDLAGDAQPLVAPAESRESGPPGERSSGPQAEPLIQGARTARPGDPFATGAGRRRVERDVQLTLAAEAGKVQSVADDVFEVVRRHQGIVLSSTIREGAAAGASFDLLIPSGRLGPALGDLSGLAEVRSRSEGTLDITKPFITVSERLRDARAEAEALLEQLAEATTETEIESIRARLAGVRAEIAALRAAKERLERRAEFARVSLDVISDEDADSGAWTIGDAFDDAGRVLTLAAGVAVVSLAALLPLGLVLGLGWGARRVLVRRGREAALGPGAAS
jgi:Domain of unknown function (DUF4349)